MLTSTAWRAAVDDPKRQSLARTVAVEVLSRLREPDRVQAAAMIAQSASGRRSGRWLPHSLAQGCSGVALALGHAERCFPGEGWDRAAHQHLARAVEGTDQYPIDTLGLFSGLAGLVYTTSYLSTAGTRYNTLRAGLEESLIAELTAQDPDGRPGLPVGVFDLISGWTGLAACLLGMESGANRDAALHSLLSRLVAVTRVEDDVPAWYTPHHLIVDEGMRDRYPGSVINCGMAHGITGVLALLALTYSAGEQVAGHAEAIRECANWLVDQGIPDQYGITYPAVVEMGRDASPRSAGRDAWCYGGPGVARALWLAGVALADSGLTSAAAATLRATLRRPVPLRRIDSPGFCHGVAGLLQITLRFAADTGDDAFRTAAQRLVDQLLDDYRPESVFGYQTVEPEGTRADRPGLLEGAPAVALALLAAATDEPPSWDRLFLLS